MSFVEVVVAAAVPSVDVVLLVLGQPTKEDVQNSTLNDFCIIQSKN